MKKMMYLLLLMSCIATQQVSAMYDVSGCITTAAQPIFNFFLENKGTSLATGLWAVASVAPLARNLYEKYVTSLKKDYKPTKQDNIWFEREQTQIEYTSKCGIVVDVDRVEHMREKLSTFLYNEIKQKSFYFPTAALVLAWGNWYFNIIK